MGYCKLLEEVAYIRLKTKKACVTLKSFKAEDNHKNNINNSNKSIALLA
jgi:hypothetical protein